MSALPGPESGFSPEPSPKAPSHALDFPSTVSGVPRQLEPGDPLELRHAIDRERQQLVAPGIGRLEPLLGTTHRSVLLTPGEPVRVSGEVAKGDSVQIYTRDKFYSLLEDVDFRDQIAGIAGHSLRHVQKGFGPNGSFSSPFYQSEPDEPPYMRMLLNSQLTEEVLGEDSAYSLDQMIRLATEYSLKWAIREAVSENDKVPLIRKKDCADYLIEAVYLAPPIPWMSTSEHERREKSERRERLSLFGSEDVYDEMLDQVSGREGVLMVYQETPEFVGFLKELKAKGDLVSGDNADHNTAKLYVPVPEEHVILVPMGEYEESGLLV